MSQIICRCNTACVCFALLNFLHVVKIFRSVVTAPKVVTSRYMQAAAAKGPMKADRVSLVHIAFGQFVHTVFSGIL